MSTAVLELRQPIYKKPVILAEAEGEALPFDEVDLYSGYKDSHYYQRFIAKYEGTPLGDLHERLMQPFFETGTAPDLEKIIYEVVSEQSNKRRYTADVVNNAYNLRYVENGGEIEDIAYDKFDQLPSTQSVAAVQEVRNSPVVLGTFRITAGQELDVFELFTSSKNSHWPHERSNGKNLIPGELGRFSLHPILDYLRYCSDKTWRDMTPLYKRKILQGLWPHGMQILKDKGVEVPYFILAPEVKDFVESAGIYPVEVEGIVPSETPKSTRLRQKFNKYWRPDKSVEEQPRVYIAPWDVDVRTMQMEWEWSVAPEPTG